jgi:trans-aconitate methyltransferase
LEFSSSVYVSDVRYVRNFIRETAPAWLDHVALVSGFEPPIRDRSFTWCDLGCGAGVTAAILAATHPTGAFHGIDAMPIHMDDARRLRRDAEIPNVHFHTANFSAASALDLPAFDYIVSHGVYTWVGSEARRTWLHFIDRHLKPNGLVYVSYNALPGRAADLPFQRLVRTLGEKLPGDTNQRMTAALQVAGSMMALNPPSLTASAMAQRCRDHAGSLDLSYLAHEVMVQHWEPCCVTDVRAELASIGLKPAGSATLVQNYDRFMLGRAARDILAKIADPDARELARDMLINQSFRRDVYIRGGQVIAEADRSHRLMNSSFYLSIPASSVEYGFSTPAGNVKFDNRAARHIVKELAAGPRRLGDLAVPEISAQDLLANAVAHTAASTLWPVEAADAAAPVEEINNAIRRRAGTPDEIRFQALPFGTAIPMTT